MNALHLDDLFPNELHISPLLMFANQLKFYLLKKLKILYFSVFSCFADEKRKIIGKKKANSKLHVELRNKCLFKQNNLFIKAEK